MQLSVMMPCYLEAENLKTVLPNIDNVLSKIGVESEILVVDTMEPMDDTNSICDSLNETCNNIIRYVPRQGGNNYGDAIRTGIQQSQGKYLVVMDADGSHNPEDIERLYSHIINNNSGVVIGSRYMKGGNTDNPFILKLMSYILNICYRLLFNLNVKDVSDSYRIYDVDIVKNLQLQCDNFDIVEEILIQIKDKFPDALIEEIPIVFNKRVHGESKRDLLKFVFSYLSTIRRLKKIQRGR